MVTVTTKHEVFFQLSGESESEGWWFEVRPDGVGRKQPRPIGELCSVSAPLRAARPMQRRSDVRNIRDTCSFVTVDPSVLGVRPRKNAASIEEVETLGWRPDARGRN